MDAQISILHTPMFFLSLFTSLLTLITGLYLGNNNTQSKLSRAVGFALITASVNLLFGAISSAPLNGKTYILFFRISWAPALIGALSIYYASIVLRETLIKKLALQRKTVVFFWAPLYSIFILITSFTNFFLKSQPIKSNNFDLRGLHPKVTEQMGMMIATQGILSILTSYNCYKALKEAPKQKYYKRRLLVIFIGSLIFAFSMTILLSLLFLHDLGKLGSKSVIELLYLSLFLIAQFIIVFAIVEYNAFIEEGRKIFKDFILFLLNYSFWAIIYTLGIVFVFKFFDSPDILPIMLGLIPFLSILTVHFNPTVQTSLVDFLEKRKIKIPRIQEKEINFITKYASSANKLSKSKLMSLQIVQLKKRQLSLSKVEALRAIIEEAVEEIHKSIGNGHIRSRALIKYEIVRMIVEEQAVESQILWDLGFESSSHIRSTVPPRFPPKKNSEYKATSVRSYRRLRKEAMNEFRWQLEQMERAALRL